MSTNGACYSSSWTREQDKAFETGLAIIPEDDFYRWQKIAEMVPGKTVEEIKCHYEILVEDINAIESDLVPLPCYDGSLENDNLNPSSDFGSEGWQFGKMLKTSTSRRKSSKLKRERRKKGIAWTEEEHRLFLEGLAKYGRGDWRSISRLCVISRTPTQVASHAQKYFMRLNSSTNEKRRPSINDITDKGKAVESSDPQPPVKAQAGKAAGRSSSKKSRLQALSCDPDDISNFVPPTIVQSSYDLTTELAAPTAVASSQKETVQDDMALSPDSFFACLPEITKLF